MPCKTGKMHKLMYKIDRVPTYPHHRHDKDEVQQMNENISYALQDRQDA